MTATSRDLQAALNVDQITEMITRELPGLRFRVQHDDSMMLTTLDVQRNIEAWRYPIANEFVARRGMVGPILTNVLDEIRRKVTEDYGLTPYIERLKTEAAKEAREAMARALVQFAEQYREKIPTIVTVQDEDDPEIFYEEQSWVAGNLPREVQALVSRAQQLGGAR